MALLERLAFLITAKDETGRVFKKVGDNAEKDLGNAEKKIGSLESRLGKFAGVGSAAGQGIGQISPGLASAVTSGKQLAASLSGAETAAVGLGLGAVAAGTAIGVMAAKGVGEYRALASEVRAVQRVTGATAEDASKLNAVFKMTGVDASTGATGIFRLSRNIESHADTLRADGIEIVKNRRGQVDLTQSLFSVAAAYQRAGKGAAGNKILFDAFGRSGLALAPILGLDRQRLEEFVAAAEKHHEILKGDDPQKALELDRAMKELNASMTGLEVELGRNLVPALTSGAKAATRLIEDVDRAAQDVTGFGSAVAHAVHVGLGPFAGAVDDVTGAMKRLAPFVIPGGTVFDHLFHGGKKAEESLTPLSPLINDAVSAMAKAQGMPDPFAPLGDSADSAASKVQTLADKLDGITSSAFGIADAEGKVSDEFDSLLDKANANGKARADSAKRFADVVEQSNRRIRDAEQNLSDAKEDLNKISSGDRTDARRRVRDAEQGVADAKKDAASSIADAKKNTDDWTASLDANTQKGRENRDTVQQIVDKTIDVAKEMEKQGRPLSEITAYIDGQLARLQNVGTQIGFNKTQLQDFLNVLKYAEATISPPISGSDFAAGSFGLGGGSTGAAGGPQVNVYVIAQPGSHVDAGFARNVGTEVARQLPRTIS